MARSTQLADLFRSPAPVAQRNDEICKAYYLDSATAEPLAERFGLNPDSVRATVGDFAHDPDLEQFFVVKRPRRQTAPKRAAVLEDGIWLRQQGLSQAQIQQRLHEQGHSISESYLSRLLASQGLADIQAPRCQQAEDAPIATDGSEIPAAAAARLCSFAPGRCLHSKVAGLFLFVPLLLALDLPAAVTPARWPGSHAVPALQAILALLTAKLLDKRRISHITDRCNDEGAGLESGRNVLPKTTFAPDYSYRTDRGMNERFLAALLSKAPVGQGPFTFKLDLHAIALGGDDAEQEKHWLTQRNRAGAAHLLPSGLPVQRRALERGLRAGTDGGCRAAVPRVGTAAEGLREGQPAQAVPQVRGHDRPCRKRRGQGDQGQRIL